jgi:hypothetical protein
MQNQSLVPHAGSQMVIDFVLKHVYAIYLETYELDQNWADHDYESVVESASFIARDHQY